MLASLQVLSLCITTALAQTLEGLHLISVQNPVICGEDNLITFSTTDKTNPVELSLVQGNSSSDHTIEVLTDNATGGEFHWLASPKLYDGTRYAMKISQDVNVDWFRLLTVQGGQVPAQSSRSSAAVSSVPTPAVQTTSSSSSPGTASSPTQPKQTKTSGQPAADTGATQATSGSSGGLSTGAEVGIGIGVAAVAVIAAIVAFVVFRRRSKAKERDYNAAPFAPDAPFASDAPVARYEKDSRPVASELGTKANTHELGGEARRGPYELPDR